MEKEGVQFDENKMDQSEITSHISRSYNFNFMDTKAEKDFIRSQMAIKQISARERKHAKQNPMVKRLLSKL